MDQRTALAWMHRWIPVLAVAVLIYVQSVAPAPTGPEGSVPFSLLLHVAAYATLGALLFRAVRYRSGTETGVVAVCAVFGLLIEMQQYTLPTRYFSLLDAAANTAGAAAATSIIPPVRRIMQGAISRRTM